MSRLIKIYLAFLLCPLLLSGCWDLKVIQDLNYITSIGFDYVDKQYVVYVQMLDFTSVAKSETGKPNQHVPVWIGTAKSETIYGALNELYRTAQMRLFYGQINSIVLGENLMKKGGEDIREFLNRYYESRYTPWLFGTTEPIDQLFSVTPFFNFSPLLSMLHQPQETYRQESKIAPITIREFIADYNEPANSAMIPSLSKKGGNWKSDASPRTMLTVDGVHVFKNGNYQGKLSASNVIGLRWVEPKTIRSPLVINENGEPQVSVSLESPKIKVTPLIKDGAAIYNLDVELTGIISEVLQPVSQSDLEQKVKKQVESEIKSTFVEGLKINADLLQLEHALYHQKNSEWKKLRDSGKNKITEDSLTQIRIKIYLSHSGRGVFDFIEMNKS